MDLSQNKSNSIASLRQQAEEVLKNSASNPDLTSLSYLTLELLHELEVHQVELELQNEELLNQKINATVAKEKFSDLYNSAPNGYFTLSQSGEIIDLNNTAADLLKKDKTKLIGSLFGFFVTDETKPILADFLQKVLREKNRESCEITLLLSENIEIFVQLTGVVNKTGDQCLVTVIDITKKKQDEAIIQQEREFYKDLVNNQPAGIYRIRVFSKKKWRKNAWESSNNPPYKMELASDRFCEILGITHSEFEANTAIISDLIHPQDKHDFILKNEEANTKICSFEWEGRLIIRDKIIWVHFESFPRPLENGDILWTGIIYNISERKQAELALKESDKRFQMLFDKAPLGYQSLDFDGCFIEVNQQWLDTLGYQHDEVIGKWFGDFLSPNYKDGFRKRFPIFKAQGHIHSEFEMVHKNGTILFIAFDGRIGYDVNGDFKQTHCILPDITESKRINEALLEAEWKFKALFELGPIGVAYHKMIYDDAGKPIDYYFIDANESYNKLTGVNPKGMTVRQAFPGIENDTADWIGTFGHVAKTGETIRFEQYLESNGRWYDCVGYQYKPDHFVAAFNEITLRKQTENALRESEAKFRNTFENSVVGISLTTINGKLSVNKAFSDIVGYSEDELKQLNWKEITHQDDVELNVRIVNSILNGEKDSDRWEKRYIHKNGNTVWVDISTFLQRNEVGNPLFFITSIIDISEKKKSEYEILIQSKRLKSIVNVLQFPTNSIQEYLDFALSQAIVMTDSKIGYIYHYNEKKKEFVLNAWSNEVMNECKIVEQQTVYQLDKTGLWGEAVRQRKPIVVNDFLASHPLKKGYPDGHAPLYKYLTIPIFVNQEIVGVVAVANKKIDYVDVDTIQLTILMDIVWKSLERKKSEIALRNSEEMMISSQSVAHICSYSTTLNENELEKSTWLCSPEFYKIFGIDETYPHTIAGWIGFIHPDHRDELIAYHEFVVKNKISFSHEYKIIRIKDGAERWVEGTGELEYDKQGNPVRMYGAIQDITERKIAENELIEREVQYHNLANSGTALIWAAGLDKLCFYFNDPWLKFTGRKMEQELGNGWTESVHPDDFDRCLDIYVTSFDKRIAFEMEYRMRNAAGEYRWILDLGNPNFNSSGEFVGYIGHCFDITDRKKTQEALQESEKKLSALFTSMTEIVVLHELVLNEMGQAINYRIIDCNDTFTQITGIEKENANGKLATEVYQTESAPYLEEYTKVCITGQSMEYKTYYAPMDKHFIISAVSVGLNQFATITTDITAIEKTHEVVQEKNKELENYIYVASHDLRSPLVNIQGFSQRLERQANELKRIVQENSVEATIKSDLDKITHEEIPKSLNFILSNVLKMDTLINGLLQLSRTGRILMSIKKIDMNKLLKSILSAHNYELTEIEANVQIDNLDDCYGDENQLNQLFSNIIHNAIKYRDKSRQLKIEIGCQTHFKRVIYSIKDSGLGLNSRHLEKIWDVFYRVDSSSPEAGEGIGLSLARRIVDKHEGKIWVESVEGKGSTFFIELHRNEFGE